MDDSLAKKYRYSVRVRQDIDELCLNFRHLHGKWMEYDFGARNRQRLYGVQGTISIEYRSNQYHIPILICLPIEYPERAPFCFVTPTEDMVLDLRSTEIDNNGKIRTPFLIQWDTSNKNPTRNLLRAVMEFQHLFALRCPVRSKQKTVILSNSHINSTNNTNFAASSTPPQPQESQESIQRRVLHDRLFTRAQEFVAVQRDEIEVLLTIKRDLKRGLSILMDNRDRIEGLSERVSTYERHVKDSMSSVNEFEKRISESKIESHEDVSCDDCFRWSDPLDEQIAVTTSRYAAIEDLNYTLSMAVNRKVISANEYLGYVREFSNTQFMYLEMLRVAMECRNGQNLEHNVLAQDDPVGSGRSTPDG